MNISKTLAISKKVIFFSVLICLCACSTTSQYQSNNITIDTLHTNISYCVYCGQQLPPTKVLNHLGKCPYCHNKLFALPSNAYTTHD